MTSITVSHSIRFIDWAAIEEITLDLVSMQCK
jgi:hypothetical protein